MSTHSLLNHLRPNGRHIGRRSGVVALVIVLAVLAGTSAWGFWSSFGTGMGSAHTATLDKPTTVSATSTPGSGSVSVSWTAATTGVTPAGYYVKRTNTTTSTSVFACGSSATTFVSSPCTDSSVPDGTYTYVVTAVLNSWTASSSATDAVSVTNAVATSTQVTSSANPSVVGQTVTYTATVTAQSGSATPSGSVSFEDAGQPIACSNAGGQTLNGSGAATCQVTYASPTSHSVKAVYVGATGFLGSNSNTLAQAVNKAATSTGLASSASPSKSGQQVTYTATVTVTSPGSATPGGSVDFKEGSTTICANQPVSGATATCSVTYPGVSSHGITATYSGDANLLGSTSTQFNQSVEKAATSTSLTSDTNPAVTGQVITLTVNVAVTGPGAGTPTGSVTFKNGMQTIACTGGNQTLTAGVATCTTSFASAGVKNLTADYAGDGNFAGSSSNTVNLTVNKAGTTTTLSSSANPASAGQSVALTATVASASPGAGTPGGTVQFLANGTAIAGCSAQSLTSGQATCVTTFSNPGSRTLTAVYSGNNDYNGSTSNSVNQAVRAGSGTALTSSATPAKTGSAVTYTATVSSLAGGTPTGMVTFKEGGTNIGTCTDVALVSGSASCAATYSTMGTRSITAVYGGDSSYDGSTSNAVSQKVVSSAVTGIILTGITGGNGAGAASCSGAGTATFTCTMSGGNNASVTASVAFVNSAGALTVYAADDTNVSISVKTKGGTSQITRTVLAGGTTTPTFTASKTGNDTIEITVTFAEAPWTATLNMP